MYKLYMNELLEDDIREQVRGRRTFLYQKKMEQIFCVCVCFVKKSVQLQVIRPQAEWDDTIHVRVRVRMEER